MINPDLVSLPVEFCLIRADGSEVQPLWQVLAVICKRGFRTLCPVVKSSSAGSWLVATAVYQGAASGAGEAMRGALAELGYADAISA